MNTKYWVVDNDVDKVMHNPQLKEAAKLLIENQVVAFPTETVYGLGANALSDHAVDKIFKAKGRPSDNPLIVHIASNEQLQRYVTSVSEQEQKLMDAFWPGPLTIIFPLKENTFSHKVTAGLNTVGIRMPDHPTALALINTADVPVAAPSANTSGKPSPTTAAHVKTDLNGSISAIVDAGETGVGVESTVIDCRLTPPVILRPGGISKEEIESVIGPVQMSGDKTLEGNSAPKAPGMKYTHYAPEATLYLIEGSTDFLQSQVNQFKRQGKTVGVIATEQTKASYTADIIKVCGTRNDLSTVAHALYDVLRSFNEESVDVILSEVFPYEGVGVAIMNRLEKAAGHRIIRD